MTERERKEWTRIAKANGVDISRGESLDSIKNKVQRNDEESYKTITGADAPSKQRREQGR